MQATAYLSMDSSEQTATPRITTCLWFDKQAEDAAHFYVKVFTEGGHTGRMGRIARFGHAASKVSGQPEGSIMTIEFELDGNAFLGLNGGAAFKPSAATSFIVNCRNQEEIDYFWRKLSEGGKPSRCGWIDRDKYGISWQVVPWNMAEYETDPDRPRAERVMAAVIAMTKIDIAAIERAYKGE